MLSTVCLLSLQEWNLSWKLFHKKTEKPKNKFATEDLDHFLQEKKTFYFYFYFCKEEEKPQSALVGTYVSAKPTNLIKFFEKQIKTKKTGKYYRTFPNTKFYYFSLLWIMVSLLGQNFGLNREIFAKTSIE